jgi:hypothetical protein
MNERKRNHFLLIFLIIDFYLLLLVLIFGVGVLDDLELEWEGINLCYFLNFFYFSLYLPSNSNIFSFFYLYYKYMFTSYVFKIPSTYSIYILSKSW